MVFYRAMWTKKSGAFFIVNYNDDNQDNSPDAVDFSNDGLPENENKTIENAGDSMDQAPLVIRKTGTLPDGARLFLKVGSVLEGESVHIFPSLAPGTQAILGDLGDRLPNGKPAPTEVDITTWVKATQDVTFGIEGMFYRYVGTNIPKAVQFGGYLDLTLELRDKAGKILKSDSAQMKVAPLILLPNTQASQQVWAADTGGDNDSFLHNASAAPGYYGLDNSKQLHAVLFGQQMTQWFQDHATIGYTQRPGEQPIWSVFRLPYVYQPDPKDPPIVQPPWVKDKLLTPATGVFQLGKSLGASYLSGDFGGNLQVVPPTPKYELGQIVIGDDSSQRLRDFLTSQEVQPVFTVAANWLRVDHTDEIFGFDAQAGAPIQVLAASPDDAYKQMKTIPAANRGSAVLFSTGNAQSGTVPAVADTNAGFRIETGVDLTGKTAADWKYIRIYADGGSRAGGQIAQISQWGNGWVEVNKVWDTTTRLASDAADTLRSAWTWSYGLPAPSRTPAVKGDLWFHRPAKGDKFVLIQDSQRWSSGTPAAVTVQEALADKNFRDLNDQAQKQIDAATAILVRQAGGPKQLQVKNLPVLFTGPAQVGAAFAGMHQAYAITPDLANFQPIAGNDYFPRQFGPRDGTGKDVFEAAARAVAANALFVDDWQAYHIMVGEVHCGSLVKRTPYNLNWWDNQP